jgi:hypothetical protein
LVIGAGAKNEVVIAKYDAEGRAVVTNPLRPRYSGLDVRLQRVAVINEGYFAFGTYAEAGGPRALFIMRFGDGGFLDLDYGPLRDGIARAQASENFDVSSVGAPVVEGEMIRLRLRGEDVSTGTETEKDQIVLAGGAQAMPKDLQPVPAACELINHRAFKGQTQLQITQASCGELIFRSQGPFGADALKMATNGTVYYSNYLGEMRWSYEGPSPVLVSRDPLGFVKKEYASFVQGRTSICGTAVDAQRRYLVFSAKKPQNPDWLANCWFM